MQTILIEKQNDYGINLKSEILFIILTNYYINNLDSLGDLI